MKVNVHSWYTDIVLTFDEVMNLCNPGAGDDTCIFLVGSCEGFQCAYFNGPSIPSHMYEGEGNAKRQGCEFVKNIEPSELGVGEHKLKVE